MARLATMETVRRSVNTLLLSDCTSEYLEASGPKAPAPGRALLRKASNNTAMEALLTAWLG